jgi:hypothetical protein
LYRDLTPPDTHKMPKLTAERVVARRRKHAGPSCHPTKIRSWRAAA